MFIFAIFNLWKLFSAELLNGDYGDRVVPFLEDLIAEAYNPERILSLLSIQSLVCGGLKPATYNTYLRLFVQVYFLPTLLNMVQLREMFLNLNLLLSA